MMDYEKMAYNSFWLLTGHARAIEADDERTDSEKLADLVGYIKKYEKKVKDCRDDYGRQRFESMDCLSHLIED